MIFLGDDGLKLPFLPEIMHGCKGLPVSERSNTVIQGQFQGYACMMWTYMGYLNVFDVTINNCTNREKHHAPIFYVIGTTLKIDKCVLLVVIF